MFVLIFRWLRRCRLLLILACLLIGINLLFYSPLADPAQPQSEAQKHILQQIFLNKAVQPPVDKVFSHGVHEEENAAHEVLDVEGAGKESKPDVNAANEVNSNEPALNPESVQPGIANYDWRKLRESEIKKLSVLGRRMFLGENVGTPQRDKNFTILFWKTGANVERRLLREYGKVNKDPFRKCSVNNCILTYEDSALDIADAVLVHLHRTRGPATLPVRTSQSQRWIWLSDENPYHTFMMAKDKDLAHYNGFFNWSMTYRMDSDVPVPSGRTLVLSQEEVDQYQPVDYHKQKPKLVAIMGSNCGGKNKRWNYVRELQKHLEVDAYGGCGTLKCPGHFTADCPALTDYKFYLSFENGDCLEYFTEKVWWNAIQKGAVPVVMGSRPQDYARLLPPNSFIHINDFKSPKHLADHIRHLDANPSEYNRLHAWRAQYRVVNEHGYFGTEVFHYCRICEALNYNDPTPKMYNNMEQFWNKTTQCFPPIWDAYLKEEKENNNDI